MSNQYAAGQERALLIYGLVKTAAVPGAVKQYRRAAQAFEEASRLVRAGGPGTPITKGWALHGTKHLPEAVEAGRIFGSSLGQTGQHGAGAYFWRGFPTGGYLQGSGHEGIATDLKSLPNRRPAAPNIYTGRAATDQVVSGPGDYHIRPKDTAIIDTATRAGDQTLGPVKADAQDAKMRVTDSAIFQRARQQIQRANAKKPLPPPTKQELVSLLRRRERGLTS